MDGRALLDQSDRTAESGDVPAARALLVQARMAFQRAGDKPGIAAVLRREAYFGEGEGRRRALREAILLSRAAGDRSGEAEGLEELSRAYADAGETGPAVALLGAAAEVQAAASDRNGEARAIELAGRLLCEAWGEARDPASGIILLLWSAELSMKVNVDLGRMIEDYVRGYQYTLSNREFRSVEELLDLNRRAVVDATLLRYRDSFRVVP